MDDGIFKLNKKIIFNYAFDRLYNLTILIEIENFEKSNLDY